MPEGPELAHSRDRLRSIILGKNILDVLIESSGRYAAKPPYGFEEFLSFIKEGSAMINSIETKGKLMWWEIIDSKENNFYIHSHYGMSGAWQTKSTKHSAISIQHGTHRTTRDQQRLYFNDPRHFGTIRFIHDKAAHEKKLRTLGPCILGENITTEIFAKNLLRRTNRNICEALMDQSALSGVGNYLRAEILFDCGIDPWRNVMDVTATEYVALRDSTIRITRESYETQGASIKSYRTVDDEKGTTQFSFKIYAMKKCPRGHVVQRMRDAGARTIHWCSICQK